MAISDKWLTIDELAEYLKMGRTKLYTMAQMGKVPGNKIGSQWRFDREEIDQWIKSGDAADAPKGQS
jgi:PTS system nitrogen regulatory IIA component